MRKLMEVKGVSEGGAYWLEPVAEKKTTANAGDGQRQKTPADYAREAVAKDPRLIASIDEATGDARVYLRPKPYFEDDEGDKK